MKHILFCFLACSGLCFSQQWESVGGGMTSGPQIRDIWMDTTTNEIYVSGDFFEMGGNQAHGLAKWDGTNWTDQCSECSNYQIYSVLKYHDTLYIAGNFWLPEFVPTYAARLTTNGWESIADIHENCRLYGFGDSLYIMGFGDTINGVAIPYVAQRSGESWQTPFAGNDFFDNPLFHDIHELIRYNSILIMGGNFWVDSLKEITWYDNGYWRPLGNGIFGNSSIHHMIVYKGILYIGGMIDDESGNPADYLIAWNGSEFFNPFPEVEFTYNIRDLQIFNDELYIVSQFNYVNDPTTYFFAKFDGENFCSFGGSFPGIFDVNTSPPTHIRELNGEIYTVCSSTLFNDTVNNIAHWLGSEMDTCIYSPVNAVDELKINQNHYHFFPNPASDEITFRWLAQTAGKHDFVLYDVNGRKLATYAFTLLPGENELSIDLSMIQRGTYLLDTGEKILKIIKE